MLNHIGGTLAVLCRSDGVLAHREDVPALTELIDSRRVAAMAHRPGPSVVLSRQSGADSRGVVVLSRNANVATGKVGADNAAEVRSRAAALAGVPEEQLLIASTGVIGRPYPMDLIRSSMDALPSPLQSADFPAAARAIMTTDTRPEVVSLRCGDATVLGIAKGVDMIEPNMATMLAFFFTDAEVEAADLDTVSGGWWTARSTRSASTPTRRPVTARWCSPTGWRARSTSPSSRRSCTARR
nr:bifunctional ornithine acetyltransferase/N-acetylglutamate synthase [Lentzea indica]